MCNQILRAAKWLSAKPIKRRASKRKRLNNFIGSVNGCKAYFSYDKSFISWDLTKYPDFYNIFCASRYSYKIQHPLEKDEIILSAISLRTVLEVYKLGGTEKIDLLEKFIKIDLEIGLESWLSAEIALKDIKDIPLL